MAEEAGEVVGYAASLRRPAYAPSVMSSIYLHPEHTGKGIGEKVYTELIENMKLAEDVPYQSNPGSERRNCFRWPVCSMKADTNLVGITMSYVEK